MEKDGSTDNTFKVPRQIAGCESLDTDTPWAVAKEMSRTVRNTLLHVKMVIHNH